jgi:putative addiction module component (TIGR02574 family)
MVAKNLLESVIALPIEERLELLDRLSESVRNDAAVSPLSDEHRQILDQRLADYERDPDEGLPWEQVKAQILARVRRS